MFFWYCVEVIFDVVLWLVIGDGVDGSLVVLVWFFYVKVLVIYCGVN